jgi:thiamine monophosphate synthase
VAVISAIQSAADPRKATQDIALEVERTKAAR